MKIKYITLALAFFGLLLFGYSVSQASSFRTLSRNNIIVLTNRDRSELGLPPLKENQNLDLAASLKISDMGENSYFAHISPLGKTPWYFLRRASYNFQAAGENLAENFTDAQDLEMAWMKSPEHRANILNPEFTEIGVAEKQIKLGGRLENITVEYLAKPQ